MSSQLSQKSVHEDSTIAWTLLLDKAFCEGRHPDFPGQPLLDGSDGGGERRLTAALHSEHYICAAVCSARLSTEPTYIDCKRNVFDFCPARFFTEASSR
eukprot:5631500-Amphidinium_carterae.1